MIIKTAVLLSLYIFPFVLMLVVPLPFWAALLCWSLMGFAMAGIGMSVMHDANHGAYSSNARVNHLLGAALNLLGGASFNWKLQHNILHHTYTNVSGMDDDINDKLGMRFSPHTKVRWFHKGQFIYAFFLYSIITLYWVTFKDFVQLILYTRTGVNPNSPFQNFIMFLRIILIKACYFFVILFVPVYFAKLPFTEVLTGFIILHVIGGLILSAVFQLAHTVERTIYPRPDKDGMIMNNWAIHQMHTTCDFARDNKFISWYVGGLNFQVEHHLFPRICHAHYPALSHIVKHTSEEFGIPFLENPTLGAALRSHINTLVRFGQMHSINDIIAG